MVISYIKMLYVTSSKKILPWIILALGLLGTICAFYFAIHGTVSKGGLKTLGNTIYAVPFFGLSFYATVIAIHLFKDHEKDGTELLVISKPLSRRNILLAKFFVLFSIMIAIHLLYFFGMLIATTADTRASMYDKVMPAVSVLIGGFVISTLIASLAIFFSCFIGSLGTLFATASIVAIFPIAGIVLQQTVNQQYYRNYAKTFSGLNADGTIRESSDDIYQFPSEGSIDGHAMSQEQIYQKYKKDDKYASASYGDIWYQWSQFYSIFNTTAKVSMDSKKIVSRETTIPRTEYSIEDKNHVLHTFFLPHETDLMRNLMDGSGQPSMDFSGSKEEKIDMQKLENRAKGLYTWLSTDEVASFEGNPSPAGFPKTGAERLAWFNTLDFMDRMSIVYGYVINTSEIIGSTMVQKSLYSIVTNSDFSRTNLYDLYVYNKMKAAHSDITLPTFSPTGSINSREFYNTFKVAGEKIVSYESKDYIPKGIVVAIWLPIALLLVSLASWRYIKKDFK